MKLAFITTLIVLLLVQMKITMCRYRARKLKSTAPVIPKRVVTHKWDDDPEQKPIPQKIPAQEITRNPKQNSAARQILSLKSIQQSIRSWEKKSYEEMSWLLEYLNRSCAPYAHLYSIGSSVQNREIWVLALSDNPSIHEVGEPEVKIIGNIHGNEDVGREVILHLLDYICSNIENDSELDSIVRNTRIHFLPSLNPDGSYFFSYIRIGNGAFASRKWQKYR
uniref:Carboxypeptidase D (Trinotate prediction) n=1 Tax=Myxobolus squamalis TaxID=59785 RepID=A0A6B2FZB1_MYXSQ